MRAGGDKLPAEIGLAHYSKLIGGSIDCRDTPDALPVYALLDRRQDGRRRILSEHVDPEIARAR